MARGDAVAAERVAIGGVGASPNGCIKLAADGYSQTG